MKKNIFHHLSKLSIAVLSIGTIVISLHSDADQFENEAYEEGEHPGYYEQFYQMKQNENGEYSPGLWRTWRNQTRKMNKAQFFKEVREVGPTNIGGRIRSLVVDYANPNRLLTGGVSGGMWVSESAGANWVALDDEAATLSITGITQSPFDYNVFYYCTGEGNNGTHVNWDGDGIFKSVDGGKTFFQLDSSLQYPGFNTTWDIEHSRTDSNTFYVATAAFGLWRSQDGGITYEQIFKSGTDIDDVDALEDGTVYFSKQSKGIYSFKETSGTPVITELNATGLPTSGIGRIMVEPCRSQPNAVYAAFAGSDRESLEGVYKSTDTAKTFTRLSNRSQTSYNQIWHNFVLAVDPADADFVVLAGVTAEYSTNGGSTWRSLLNTHSDYHDMTFVPGTSDFYSVSDGGVYKYNKSTARTTAINCNTNLNVTQFYAGFYFPDGDEMIVGAQDNWTTMNTTGGSTFTQVLSGDGMWNGVSSDGNIVYGSSQNGNIRRSANGSSWFNCYTPLSTRVGHTDFWFANPFELNPINGQNIFFPTKNVVARSSNMGSSWTVVTNAIPGNIFNVGVTPENDPTLFFGGQSGLLYRVNNANSAVPGDEFKMFTLSPVQAKGGFIGQIKVDPNDYTTIYTPYSNASSLPRLWKILKADSDEPEWVDISGNLPTSLPVNWIEVDPLNSNHLMIATDYGLYISINGGKWWEKETRIPNVYVTMLRLRPTDRRLFVYTFGRGAWVADLDDDIFSSAQQKATLAVRLYPNPAMDIVTIEGQVSGDYELINLSGKSIQSGTMINGSLNVSNLANGTYILRLNDANGANKSAKLIVQH
ncbi:MAG: T9SS type A sorting domain-containing protein [Flavobacteriales bacterium]|nr:T9SS type A sorting domain-containing protein [Bacteroidota bacterium]MCB9241510.1 T9SS type A sorting domain-containing protein [Flavobacteriales bacterium]